VVSCSAGQINKLYGLQLLVYGSGNKTGHEACQLVEEIQSYVTERLNSSRRANFGDAQLVSKDWPRFA
jgi:hypothetical protein